MKRKLSVLLIGVSLLGAGAWAKATEVRIGVRGMVCGFCAQGIEKKFHAQAVVDQVKVSLGQKLVSLTLKEGQNIDDDTIRSILTEAGYNVEKIERN